MPKIGIVWRQTIARMNIEDCPGLPMWMEKHEYLGNAKEGQLHVVSPHPWFRRALDRYDA